MARAPWSVTALNILCVLLLLPFVPLADNQSLLDPQFSIVKVINLTHGDDTYRQVEFEVHGRNLIGDGGHGGDMQIRTTLTHGKRNELCGNLTNYEISEKSTSDSGKIAQYVLTIPVDVYGKKVFFCLPRNNVVREGQMPPSLFTSTQQNYYHQGSNIFIELPFNESLSDRSNNHRSRRQRTDQLSVLGLRLEVSYKDAEFDDNGIPDVLSNAEHTIRLFGSGFLEDMMVTVTSEEDKYGEICEYPSAKAFPIVKESFSPETVLVRIKLPTLKAEADTYYLCVKDSNSSKSFLHQGSEPWLQIRTYDTPLPLWVTILIICTCLMFSALFSGLNLGLMSLDRTELKILCNTGTVKERRYARAIQPVRNHGNFLLCSILLGNVCVNSIFTILLDGLTSGLIAVIFSTIAIVLFGEITPQAICSRHGLAVGAKTIYVTKCVMALTAPLAYPVSKFLDYLLGEEIGNVYNRERLKELVKVTTGENDLDKDEVNIISGALELRKKTVADVMTKIEDVFMLDYEAVLDFETVSEIMKSGFSRVPVFEGNRQNIVTMLYIKDLAFVDPDDNTPLKTLCQFYQNPCNFVFEDVTLDVMFRIFKEGNKGHMAFVHRVNNEGEGDPFYETIGLITLEDVIEELIQAEIMDETDVFTDNRTKRRRTADRRQDFTVFAERRGETNKIRISPQLTLAAFQFLSTAVEQFVPSSISETILKRLLKQDIIYHIKKNKEWRTEPTNVIYQQGKPSDYFVLILEGRVEVTVGKENLNFEGGPFTYFGTQALIQNIGVAESPSGPTSTIGSLESLNLDAMLRHSFQPDYTVRAITEVIYLRIKRSLYLAAKRATLMERSQRDNPQGSANFDEEVDKLLHSLDEDDGDSPGRRTPARKQSTKNLQHIEPSQLVSNNTSPKTSLYANVSPPHRIKDVAWDLPIKSSAINDILPVKDEEVSLLPKKS